MVVWHSPSVYTCRSDCVAGARGCHATRSSASTIDPRHKPSSTAGARRSTTRHRGVAPVAVSSPGRPRNSVAARVSVTRRAVPSSPSDVALFRSHSPLLTCHSPLFTFHLTLPLPLATSHSPLNHLPLATSHLPLTTCHSPLSTPLHSTPLATCHLPLATCHFSLSTLHSPLTTCHFSHARDAATPV